MLRIKSLDPHIKFAKVISSVQGLSKSSLNDILMLLPVTKLFLLFPRWSRPLRPLFAVNFPEMRQIRRSFRNLRRTLPDVVNVLFLFFFSLAIFALMAYKLFGERSESILRLCNVYHHHIHSKNHTHHNPVIKVHLNSPWVPRPHTPQLTTALLPQRPGVG